MPFASVTWSFRVVEAQAAVVRDASGIMEISCSGCGTFLGVSQPVESRPEHLLGTCLFCRSWSLINLARDPVADLMVFRPDDLDQSARAELSGPESLR